MEERFGLVLKKMRESAALTQLELANLAGLSVAAIRDLEQHRNRSPRPRSIRALIEALGLGGADAAEFQRAAFAGSFVVQGVSPPPPEIDAAESTAIGVLGPLVLLHRGVPQPMGNGRHRMVLARLALTPNTVVYRDELVDLLWDRDIPPSAVNLVQTYVSRLRRLLEPHLAARRASEMLTLAVGGYRLNVDPDQLDLTVFRRLVSRARAAAAEARSAVGHLEEALDLWRGDAVADVAVLANDPLATGLTNERIDAAVLYATIAEKLARSEEALPRLRDLANRFRLHEPLQARYIAALAATNRQAAALEVFDSVRRQLSTDLGIDPSPELAKVYDDVLHQRAAAREEAVTRAGAALVPFQAARPMWTLSNFLERLADNARTLDELHVGDTAVDATFQLSYQDLAPRVARAFRLLALVPGPDFTSEAAAALLDGDLSEEESAADDAKGALQRFQEAYEMAARHPYPSIMTGALIGLARSLLATGDLQGAIHHGAFAVAKAKEGGLLTLAVDEALEVSAWSHLANAEAARAIALCREAQRLCETMDTPAHIEALRRILARAEVHIATLLSAS